MANASAFKKGEKRPNQGKRGPGKETALIRDMVATALSELGGVAYLVAVAQTHPGPFLALVGKTMPVQVTGADGGAMQLSIRVAFD